MSNSKEKTVKAIEIANLLRKALLQDGKMELTLYKYELEEHINYWYEGLKSDCDDFVFAVTENSGDVAMVLIAQQKNIYINEDARDKLTKLWSKNYNKNIKRLIPMMAEELANNIISVNGVKTVSSHLTGDRRIPSANSLKWWFEKPNI